MYETRLCCYHKIPSHVSKLWQAVCRCHCPSTSLYWGWIPRRQGDLTNCKMGHIELRRATYSARQARVR